MQGRVVPLFHGLVERIHVDVKNDVKHRWGRLPGSPGGLKVLERKGTPRFQHFTGDGTIGWLVAVLMWGL